MAIQPVITPHDACLELAASQHGVISQRQAIGLGMDRHAIHRCGVTRKWIRALPGVFRIAGVPETWQQRIHAAWLWGGEGAAISHRAAAILHGLPGVGVAPIELTLPSTKRAPRPGLVIHRSLLPPSDREPRGRLALTTATRTLIDLGAVITRDKLELALEDAIARGATSVAQIRWRLAQTDMTSRRGTRVLRQLLEDQRTDQPQLESPLEAKFESLLRKFGLPLPERQYELRDGQRFVARFDFAYPQLKLAFEVDGFVYHRGRRNHYRDRKRHNAVAHLKWDVRYVTKEMIDSGRALAQEIAQELGLTLF